MRARSSKAFAVAIAAIATACGKVMTEPDPTLGPDDVASIEIEPANAIAESFGQMIQLTATARSTDGTPIADAGLAWGSHDEATATVSASGRVTAHADGSATISASGNGVSADAVVTVSQVAAQLAFRDSPDDAQVGGALGPVVVEATDALGSLAEGFIGEVTVTVGGNPGSGALSGATSVAAVDGVASFTDLSIDAVGAGYRLVANASDLADATSEPFEVTAPATPSDAIYAAAPFEGTITAYALTPAAPDPAAEGPWRTEPMTLTELGTHDIGFNVLDFDLSLGLTFGFEASGNPAVSSIHVLDYAVDPVAERGAVQAPSSSYFFFDASLEWGLSVVHGLGPDEAQWYWTTPGGPYLDPIASPTELAGEVIAATALSGSTGGSPTAYVASPSQLFGLEYDPVADAFSSGGGSPADLSGAPSSLHLSGTHRLLGGFGSFGFDLAWVDGLARVGTGPLGTEPLADGLVWDSGNGLACVYGIREDESPDLVWYEVGLDVGVVTTSGVFALTGLDAADLSASPDGERAYATSTEGSDVRLSGLDVGHFDDSCAPRLFLTYDLGPGHPEIRVGDG